jgi:uncharacterized protein (TIGR00369 family)
METALSYHPMAELPTESPERQQRCYDWEPIDGSPPLATRSGLEYYQALRDSVLPAQPITQTIGWTVKNVTQGKIGLSLAPGAHLFHGGGLVHGGVLATLLDSAMSGAILSGLAQGQGCSTVQLNVHYVRGASPETGLLLAEGRVKHAGRTIATAEGEVTDEAGRLYAHATTTCVIFDLKP